LIDKTLVKNARTAFFTGFFVSFSAQAARGSSGRDRGRGSLSHVSLIIL
jgi:hypothetical protein